MEREISKERPYERERYGWEKRERYRDKVGERKIEIETSWERKRERETGWK